MRCSSSAATCAAKRRCSRTACARRPRRGAKIAFLNPDALRLPVPGRRVFRDAARAPARRSRGHLLRLPRRRRGAEASGDRSSPARRPMSVTVRSRPRSSPDRSAPSGWARSRCVIRRTRICARWLPASPPRRAQRSACWPKVATPRVPISPAPCRIASRAASRAPRPARTRASCSRSRRRPIYCSAAPSPGSTASAWTPSKSLGGAAFVVAATPYADDTLKSVAHVLLPISTFVETSGTYVNLEGLWQSFAGAAKPLGEARPGWKVLRVLGNLAGVADFDYQSSEEVREELRALCGGIAASSYQGSHEAKVERRRTRVSSTCRCTRSMRCCAARRRCSARAKARARRSRTAEARAHDRVDRRT